MCGTNEKKLIKSLLLGISTTAKVRIEHYRIPQNVWWDQRIDGRLIVMAPDQKAKTKEKWVDGYHRNQPTYNALDTYHGPRWSWRFDHNVSPTERGGITIVQIIDEHNNIFTGIANCSLRDVYNYRYGAYVALLRATNKYFESNLTFNMVDEDDNDPIPF